MNKIAAIEEHKAKKIEVEYDKQLSISIGQSRFDTAWKNKKMNWSYLLYRLQTPQVTRETYAEYKLMTKTAQDKAKDVGGFVAGILQNGKRSNNSVASRSIITLDLDFAPVDFFDGFEFIYGYAACIYSTHKHSSKTPRYRMLIPLNRDVSADEYEAIARQIAFSMDMDWFDDTTYQASRLMYWPSKSIDGEFVFDYVDAPFLKADDVLAEYEDWTDVSQWPMSSRVENVHARAAKKQGDPLEKDGVVGAFCRAHDIHSAISEFLSEEYIPTEKPDRYTYSCGSTSAGLVTYEDKFAYSNHGTDPASGKLCNAFDLVRIHKYIDQDADIKENVPVNKRPSYRAMVEFALSDKATKIQLGKDKAEIAKEEFSEEEEDSWRGNLEYTKQGVMKDTTVNLINILRHDHKVNKLKFNELSNSIETEEGAELPWKRKDNIIWREQDDAQLKAYLDSVYTEFKERTYKISIVKVTDDKSYHPIKDYIEGLPEWDGAKRVDTLLIDYLGAEDNIYTRLAMRKTLVAAIARTYKPGVKFDSMLVIAGETQGIGKSTLVSKLGMKWYNDSISLSDVKDKTAAEKLQGYWILELGELQGMRKAEMETLKSFFSRQDDVYRASYAPKASSHERQCVFIGTTNKLEFLRDATGDRRYWPVIAHMTEEQARDSSIKHTWDLTQDEVDQIWAEALTYYKAGESLMLTGEAAVLALMAQKNAKEVDERVGMLAEKLNKKLPEDWDKRDRYKRREYMCDDCVEEEGTVERTWISIPEIKWEFFGMDITKYERKESDAIALMMSSLDDWEKSPTARHVKGYGRQKGYVRKKVSKKK